jgi:hypothetical protein
MKPKAPNNRLARDIPSGGVMRNSKVSGTLKKARELRGGRHIRRGESVGELVEEHKGEV